MQREALFYRGFWSNQKETAGCPVQLTGDKTRAAVLQLIRFNCVTLRPWCILRHVKLDFE